MGEGGEMTQTLYAHINERKKKEIQGRDTFSWDFCGCFCFNVFVYSLYSLTLPSDK
jgi:hypothetical protein